MRHAKQFIYGVLYLIFWIALGSGVYYHFIKPPVSCFDNIQNQNEEGIDCGGVCAIECTPALKTLSTNNVWVLPIVLSNAAQNVTSTAQRVSLLAEVKDPNPDFSASGFSYTFDLYDASGKKIAAFPGFSYIYSDEVKYIAAPNLELPPGSPTVQSAVLSISAPVWKKAVLSRKPNLVVNQLPVTSNGTLSAQGSVRNAEAVPLHVDLVAIFNDATGNPLGTSITALDRLAAGETRQYAIFHPLMTSISPDRTQVFAYAYAIQ